MTAQKTTVTEPETPDMGTPAILTEPANPFEGMVYVQDTNTGNKLDRPVPESWLTRFPNLKQVPSDKARTNPTKKGGK